MTITKRFIAGAVCPRCGEMDRLVTYVDKGETYKECVSCDFNEKQVVQLEVNELNTRVNQQSNETPETEDAVQVINIIGKSEHS